VLDTPAGVRGHGRRRRVALWLGATTAILAAAAVLAWAILKNDGNGDAVEAMFTQLTFDAGQEQYPSLSPDGRWIVFTRATAPGNPDIYLQSVGGRNAINLTQDSAVADSSPAFSPDGERIAFSSARQGGGVFVMGRTGEFARKVADAGFNPAWSPDGKQLSSRASTLLIRRTNAWASASSGLWTSQAANDVAFTLVMPFNRTGRQAASASCSGACGAAARSATSGPFRQAAAKRSP
jgi:hypothetical protein